MGPKWRSLLALIPALAVAVGLASPARAEVGTYAPGAIKPVKTIIKPGDFTTQDTRASGIFSCGVPYAVVQGRPSGFVTGSCRSGTHLHRDAKSGQYNGTYWDGGFVYGSYRGCGWIEVSFNRLAGGGGETLCTFGRIGYNDNELMIASNEGTQAPYGCNRNPASGRCTDGTDATVTSGGCGLYANYQPWSSGQNPTDLIRSIQGGSGFVKWRYVSKYAAADGSGRYVMVRDTNSATANGNGNWGWMRESCLTSMPGRVAIR